MAETPIPIGCTNIFIPRVVGPSGVPEITDDASAAMNPELAVLSAIMHGRDVDVMKAVQIAAVAQRVTVGLDAERSNLYFDLVLSSLSEAARTELKKTMRPDGYEYQSDFARRYVAEGQAKGRVAIVTRLLSARFGPLSEEVKKQIASRSSEELDAIGDRLLTAASLEEALAPRS